MKLEDIMCVLSKAAAAPQYAEMQEIKDRIEFFFNRVDDNDEDDNDDLDNAVYTPKMFTIIIGKYHIKYPLLLLGKLTPVDTKKVRFVLGTDLELEGENYVDGKPEIRISLKKGIFKNASHLEIEGEFEGASQPEAFHQLQDKYNTLISRALHETHDELFDFIDEDNNENYDKNIKE